MISKQLKDFMKFELTEMSQNIVINYEARVSNNPFSAFTDKGTHITKYMSLGRSFDSQLGNRIQRISMYTARERYGANNVPNYIYITLDDPNVDLWFFTFPNSFVDDFGIDTYKTQMLFQAENEDKIVDNLFGVIEGDAKAKYRSDHDIKVISKSHKSEYQRYEADLKGVIRSSLVKYSNNNCDAGSIAALYGASGILNKGIPIDLFYLSSNTIFSYEIKIGGGLDTKNRESNASEVLRNERILSFFGSDKVKSYFAACYNNAGGDDGTSDIKHEKGVVYRGNFPGGPMFNIVSNTPAMQDKIIVGSVFWENILPTDVSYTEFIDAYNQAFAESKIEDTIIDLQ